MDSSDLKIIEVIRVPILINKERVSDYLPGQLNTLYSKKGVKKAIKEGLVTINDKKAFTADYLFGNEKITLFQSTIVNNKKTITIKLEIVFEDDYLAIINKPAGILVSGNKKYTIENALPLALKKSKQQDSLERPLPIHRLDYPTSGLLVIGKTSRSVILLNRMFENKEIQKFYEAVTIGQQKDHGIINSPINTKKSKTTFRVVERLNSIKYQNLNLVELIPHTGRTHQLRKHMSKIGNPIFGDQQYGIEGLKSVGNGLYLQASKLIFTHPFTENKIEISIPRLKKTNKLFPEKESRS